MRDLLQRGDVFHVGKGTRIYVQLPAKNIFANVNEGDKDANELRQTDITVGRKKKDFDTSIFEDDYVVTNTASNGGGTGMGPHDIYPNGWNVQAIGINHGKEISFYQSGSFTAMIEPEAIKLIKRIDINKIIRQLAK